MTVVGVVGVINGLFLGFLSYFFFDLQVKYTFINIDVYQIIRLRWLRFHQFLALTNFIKLKLPFLFSFKLSCFIYHVKVTNLINYIVKSVKNWIYLNIYILK